MNNHTLHADCGPVQLTLVIEREEVRTSGLVIDRGWRHVDRHGHEHRGSDLLATLREIRVLCGCGLVAEEHTVFNHYECHTCGEVVRPRTISGLLAPPQYVDVDRYCDVQVTSVEGRLTTTSTYRTSFNHGEELVARAQQSAQTETTTPHPNVIFHTNHRYLDPLDVLSELKRRDDAYLTQREVTSG